MTVKEPGKVTVNGPEHFTIPFFPSVTHMTGDRDVFHAVPVGMRQEPLWILVKTWRRSHWEDVISTATKQNKQTKKQGER